MVQGGMSCIKYLMLFFNFVFVVCGIALIVIGAVVQNKDFTVFLNNKYATAPNILIIVGVAIFVLAFLGCFGAMRENHCLLMTFGFLLFIVFVTELAGGITAYVYRNQLEGILKENMNSSIQQNKEDARKIWNEIQTKWHCCGIDGPNDYPNATRELPKSCCIPPTETCHLGVHSYTNGCFDQMLEKVKDAANNIGRVAIGIGVVELIGVLFSCCLASAIRREYQYV